MANLRKFEILDIKLSPGGPGPEQVFKVTYRAIRNKKWIESVVWIVGRNEKEARHNAEQQFGGKL